MRSTANNSESEQFCKWLAEMGYRRPDGKLPATHVAPLLRGNLRGLIPQLHEGFRSAKSVQQSRATIQEYEERYTRRIKQLHEQKEAQLRARVEDMRGRLHELKNKRDQNEALTKELVEATATDALTTDAQDAVVDDTGLQGLAMTRYVDRCGHLAARLTAWRAALRQLLEQAAQQTRQPSSSSSGGAGSERAQEAVLLQLWETSRRHLTAQLKRKSCAYSGTFADSVNREAAQQLAASLQWEPAPESRPQLQQALACNPSLLLQVLAGAMQKQLWALQATKGAGVGGGGGAGQNDRAVFERSLVDSLQELHEECIGMEEALDEALMQAAEAEAKLQGLEERLQGSEAAVLKLKVARLRARKAVVDAEVARQQQRAEVLRAAAVEAGVLERQVAQAEGWVRELQELQRGVLRLQRGCCESFPEVKAREKAFVAAAQQLCKQLTEALQYAANSVFLELRCLPRLPPPLLAPSHPDGPTLHDTPRHRLDCAARALHAPPADTHSAKDPVTLEVLRAGTLADPLLLLRPPLAVLDTLFSLHTTKELLATRTAACRTATTTASSAATAAERRADAAATSTAELRVWQETQLLPALQRGLTRAQKAQQHVDGPLRVALRGLREMPGLHAAPWHTYGGKNASEWLEELRAALQASRALR